MTNENPAESRVTPTLIKNVTRSSLRFRIPGKCVSLWPGESVEVPRRYLDTVELGVLCRQGAIVLISSPEDSPPARNEEQASTADKPAARAVAGTRTKERQKTAKKR